MTAPLPIDAVVPDVLEALGRTASVTISSPPGSGKTTRVPIAISRAYPDGDVLVLEPRRIAARAAARRVAEEVGCSLGQEVGYEVRGDRRVSSRTRLRFLTEGVLVQRLVRDPFLEGVAAVVLDEFHERHVETDLAISMLREVRDTVRDDLKVVVMSATLQVDPVQEFLAPCEHVAADGGLHEVTIHHLGGRRDDSLEQGVRAGVGHALDETEGDVLVFLPGLGEIRRCARELEQLGRSRDVDVLPLHGSLDAAAQDAALRVGARRKVVLATNVAESSITIDGVSAVVDTGLARVPYVDVARGLDALRTERISRASADQRAGRAGRTGPGRCYRLWAQGEERGMAAFDTPEVRRVDLAGPCLLVHGFSAGDPRSFAWFDRPEESALEAADELLVALGAVDSQGKLTERGRSMLAWPVHPRLARMLDEAIAQGCLDDAATIAAILDERDLVRSGGIDLATWLAAYGDVARRRFDRGACRVAGVDRTVARSVATNRDRLLAHGKRSARRAPRSNDGDAAALGRAVLAGFADRIGRCDDEGTGQLATGRGVWVDDPAFADVDYFVALRVADQGRSTRSHVRLALAIERAWIEDVFPAEVETERVAEFARGGDRAVGVTRTRFRKLVLDEAFGGKPAVAAIEQLLADTVARDPFAWLGDSKAQRPLRRFLARVAWLRDVAPELELPTLDDAAVGDALAELAPGKRSLREFRGAPLLDLLESRLDRTQRARLRQDAPERVRLASGKELRVDYDPAPSIAARLQDFFGTRETPRLGGGRVPVLLRLLAPNMRPVQVTEDLESFWANVYPKVRSELRNRYPKHAWPADPHGS